MYPIDVLMSTSFVGFELFQVRIYSNNFVLFLMLETYNKILGTPEYIFIVANRIKRKKATEAIMASFSAVWEK